VYGVSVVDHELERAPTSQAGVCFRAGLLADLVVRVVMDELTGVTLTEVGVRASVEDEGVPVNVDQRSRRKALVTMLRADPEEAQSFVHDLLCKLLLDSLILHDPVDQSLP